MASPASLWPWRKPRILTVLLAANLLLLAAPLGGLWLLRLYESALVRQTETELVAQAAVIAAAYRAAWWGGRAPAATGSGWAPRPATLDLARDAVLPPPPAPRPAPVSSDPRAALAGAALGSVLADAQRVTLAGMRVLDRQGVVVATSREEIGLSLAAQEEVAAALRGEGRAVLRARQPAQGVGATSISRAAPFRVFVAEPVRDADGAVIGAVLLSRTPASIDQALYGKRWEIAALALALLLGAGGIAGFTAYTVSRPITAVAEQARAVAAGARVEEGRVRRSAVREADELAAAIHSMAATLERRADAIGGFAADVSHEFKTPIAALRGALELLTDHGDAMAPAERARFLAQATEDVARLDRLVRRLLELARAEAPKPRLADSCALAEIAEAAAAPFRAEGMAVRLSGRDAPRVAMPAEALRSVLDTLLENVRQHAGPGAGCRMAWERRGDAVSLIFADDGHGISPGNAPRIFSRFFTTARDAGGTGLGLAIARSHLEAAGGSIALLPAEGRGARFLLSLPGA